MLRPLVLLAPLVAVLGASGCHQVPAAAPSGAEVVLQIRSGAEVRVKVELARTEGERAHGLMFRRSLDAGAGMLFLFPEPDKLKFWMRNTYIPLDMIFLGEDHHVVYVEENAEPLTETPRGPEAPSQFVLEVPGGWARTHGVEPGVVARFVGLQ